MKIVYKDYYKKKGGKTVFRYHVEGTKDEIEKYEKIQGDNLRIDEDDPKNRPLYFSTTNVGQTANLDITNNGNVVVKDDDYEALKAATNAEGDTPLGRAMASETARFRIQAILGRGQAPVAASAPAPANQEQVEASAEDLNNG